MEMTKELTKEQKIILTGYTGVLCCNNFSDFHKDVEFRMMRPVFTHELAGLKEELRKLYEYDFLSICGVEQ